MYQSTIDHPIPSNTRENHGIMFVSSNVYAAI